MTTGTTIQQYTPEQLTEIVNAYECKVFSIRKKRDLTKDKNAQRNQNNPDYNKTYYELHKHDKVKCPICDMELNRYALPAHRNSKRHLLIQGFKQTATDLNRKLEPIGTDPQ